MKRREFLKTGLAASSLALAQTNDLSSAAPVRWATDEAHRALADAKINDVRLAVKRIPGPAESFSLSRTGSTITAGGADVRGAVYALLELADRARHRVELVGVAESPLNPVRSVSRMFVSDVEDKPWFDDREMWPQYLTMLATERFNRFSLALSIGYDFLREVTDAYFLFPYPFLLAVPGFNVRATNVPDAERDHNLETLKFISEQTVARGLDFQLGLWMHGYQWINSPKANHVIEGLTPETHGPYCRAAITALLKACPAISGVTFRVHGESGVAEGSYPFWKIVFEGVQNCGRRVAIDMHSKGIDQGMIDVGLATGMPVTISPKFWAEHEGMPYHQADIRDQEVPHGKTATGLMALSSGSRSFTRYGVADLLREDRRYDVVHRIWPGSQRMLLWGDPQWTASYSRAFTFCGSKGVEVFEPLSFKGRRGSGIAGGRCGYVDASLSPRWDWEKFLYTYRVWGRLLYNPQTDPDGWKRLLRQQFGDGGAPAEAALASASKILPIITTTHMPSAANNNYWPEMYTNQPIVDARKNRYSDTPSPKVFGNVSPLDPQLFYRINDFADDLLKGERSGKYSPIEVAQWLQERSDAARVVLSQIHVAGEKPSPEVRRLATDVDIELGTGAFFAAKFRAAILYRLHERTGDRHALEEALRSYRLARAVWAKIADETKGVYVTDLTVGELTWLRGNWADRLPAIDDDIVDMEKRLASAKESDDPMVAKAILKALGGSDRLEIRVAHQPVEKFRPGKPVEVEFTTVTPLAAVRLHYRHVNQAERWQAVDVAGAGTKYASAVPGEYTDTPFPLQYYFEMKTAPDKACLHPGFASNLANQPYFVVRRG
jgi:hypothetical protein